MSLQAAGEDGSQPGEFRQNPPASEPGKKRAKRRSAREIVADAERLALKWRELLDRAEADLAAALAEGDAVRAGNAEIGILRCKRRLWKQQARRRRKLQVASLEAWAARPTSAAALEAGRVRAEASIDEDKRIRRRRAELRERLKPRALPTLALDGRPVFLQTAPKRFKGDKPRAALLAETDARPDPGRPSPPRPGLLRGEYRVIVPEDVAIRRAEFEARLAERRGVAWWEPALVDRRMIAAFETLLRLPMPTRPRAYGSAMPVPVYEPDDKRGWFLYDEIGVRRGGARLREMGPPDKLAVDRMDEALRWPTRFLAADPRRARAVGLGAMWAALGQPIIRMCERAGLARSTFLADRDLGLAVIADGLNSGLRR